MEREIKQDFTITDKPMLVIESIVIGMFALIAITSHNRNMWVFCCAVIAFIILFGRLCLRSGLKDLESGPKWMLAANGLQRLYPSGKGETILWEQIRYMKWIRYNGLIVRWEEPKSSYRGKGFKREFKYDWVYRQFRTVLRVQQDEATKLISAWQNNGSQAGGGTCTS